jgi:hypothetical protein
MPPPNTEKSPISLYVFSNCGVTVGVEKLVDTDGLPIRLTEPRKTRYQAE